MNEHSHIPNAGEWRAKDVLEAVRLLDELAHSLTEMTVVFMIEGTQIDLGEIPPDFVRSLKKLASNDLESAIHYGESLRAFRAVVNAYVGQAENTFIELGLLLPTSINVPDSLEGMEG